MTSSGVPVGDTTLLQRLRELIDLSHADALSNKEFNELTNGIEVALPAVVTLIEQAEKVERIIRICAADGIEVGADGLGAWAMLLSAALAPFVGEATQ